jgi:hypothetical protein
MTETSPVGTCASLPYRLSDLSAEEKLQIKLKLREQQRHYKLPPVEYKRE